MNNECSSCHQPFQVTNRDLEFLEKISPEFGGKKYAIPAPTQCPKCREQIRMSHRNEWSLYHRKCDHSGKQIISLYNPDSPYKVYEQSVWWSDSFDPLAYGRDFDFSRPFFEQFKELELEVPKSSINNAKSENCDYTNYSAENKNCYMVVGGLGAEDCYHSYRVFYSRDICDCYDLYTCERCYECTESANLYDCKYCTNCHDSTNLVLCSDCKGCKDCFGCANLRNAQYCIYNTQFSKEEFFEKVVELRSNIDLVRSDIEKLHNTVPHRFAELVQCENVTGDQLLQCKDCTNCYTLKNSQDCSFGRIGEHNNDCTDCNFFDNCEMQYFNCNNEKNYNVLFSSLIWYSKNVLYSMNCFNSQNLFGCTGCKKQEYCILNRQYTKEEYLELVPKIIEHMQSSGEWAQFFPPAISAFSYNETVAHDYIPLSKEEVLQHGWHWKAENQKQDAYMGPKVDVSGPIEQIPESICEQILTCEVSGKQYKVIPQELAFYKKLSIQIPKRAPAQRHKDRMLRLNPRQLWNRTCAKCSKEIQTTYAPDRPETVYCESSYLKTIA